MSNVRMIYGYASDLATATASSTAAGYDPANVVTLDRSSLWIAGGTSSVTLTLDLGSAKAITGLFLGNHNAQLWTGGVLQSSPDNAVWTTRATFSGAAADQDYYHSFGSQTYQYWRLSITSSTSAPQVGVFYLGTHEELTYNPWAGFEAGDVYNVESRKAQSGAIVSEQWGRQLTEYRMKWDVVETAAVTELQTILREEGGPLRPFVYIPRADGSSPTSGRAYLVRMVDGGWMATEIFGGLWSMALTIREEV